MVSRIQADEAAAALNADLELRSVGESTALEQELKIIHESLVGKTVQT